MPVCKEIALDTHDLPCTSSAHHELEGTDIGTEIACCLVKLLQGLFLPMIRVKDSSFIVQFVQCWCLSMPGNR